MKTTQFADNGESDNETNDISPPESATLDLVAILKDVRSCQDNKKPICDGKLLLQKNKFNHYYIRCEHFARGRRNHLQLRNLNEYNIGYLTALFQNDLSRITPYEVTAANHGYGPLYPCSVTAAAREQKQLCPMWHRHNGILQRGKIELKDATKCNCRMDIYTPNDRSRCPYILIVFRNPHTHARPPRSKTPKSIELIFNSLLQPLGWRLADATPRRILLDSTFIHSLRKILSWDEFRDPGLGDLHPSLINYDHAARLINDLRYKEYPKGTGLEGARHLLKDHKNLPPEQQYLRCIESCENAKDGKFYIVICMFRAMSHLLVKTRRPSIDTAFKRLDKWQEFEIEAWFPEFSRSVVVARAFTTSQSAEAHQFLFRHIFKIAQEDTNQSVRFRHIHGSGIETITADGHEGQALGLGLYCQEICEKLINLRSVEWSKPMNKVTPREHLMCFYKYCFTHYVRNVAKLRAHVKPNVIAAMMSLASSDPLPDYDQAITTICNGGQKALNWYENKEKGDSVPLAAIYRPLSKIPLEIWQAAPSTSNGNEQSHRNINRDGTKLTMLAGIMRGLQFDSRAMSNIDFWIAESIQPRDKLATHFHRSARGVRVKTSIQQRNVLAKDVDILSAYEKAQKLVVSITADAAAVIRALEALESAEEPKRALKRRRKQNEQEGDSKAEELKRAQERLRKHDEQLIEIQSQLDSLLPQGSGSHPLAKLPKPEEIYDRTLLDAKPRKKPAQNIRDTQAVSSQRPMLLVNSGHLYAHATPLHSYPDNVQYNGIPPRHEFYNNSQPQNGYHTSFIPQNGYYVNSQPPNALYHNSQVQFKYSLPHPQNMHPQNMIHHQASTPVHIATNSSVSGYMGPTAHPHNMPSPRHLNYHNPGYYSQPGPSFYRQ